MIIFPFPSTDLNETHKNLVKFLMALKIKVNGTKQMSYLIFPPLAQNYFSVK